ncbi:MAG: hypothetical protein L6R39_007466, partial [Caloplaca ligustica]
IYEIKAIRRTFHDPVDTDIARRTWYPGRNFDGVARRPGEFVTISPAEPIYASLVLAARAAEDLFDRYKAMYPDCMTLLGPETGHVWFVGIAGDGREIYEVAVVGRKFEDGVD